MESDGVRKHALIFAWVTRAVVEAFGAEGRSAILAAVEQYGRERGRRMGEHADELGLARDMAAFTLCGEINFAETKNVKETDRYVPAVETRSTRCSWHEAWLEHGVLEYGQVYCEAIDRAIAEGFNPELGFFVDRTLSHGASDCHFVYRGASLDKEDLARLERLRTEVGTRFLKPWSYHIADLYAVLKNTLWTRFGEAGLRAAEAGLAEYASLFGTEAAGDVSDALS